MTARLSPQRETEIRERVSAVEPDASPALAPMDDPFVIALAARLNEVAPSPAPRDRGAHLAIFEARALVASAPMSHLLSDAAGFSALLTELAAVRTELDKVRSALREACDLVAEQDDEIGGVRAEIHALKHRPEDAMHYGIRLPDGAVMDGTVTDLAEQQARLDRYRDCWPDAVLVQRDVHFGEWTEVTS